MGTVGEGAAQAVHDIQSRLMGGHWLLYLYSERAVRLLLAAIAIVLVLGASLLLGMFLYVWLKTYSDSAEVFSEMRNAAAVSEQPPEFSPGVSLSEEDRRKIVERNLFNTRVAPTPTPEPEQEDETPTRVNTDFELLGTFYSGPNSEAIIENKQSRAQEAFRIGEKVFDEAVLEAVYSDRVELRRGRELEVLHMAMLGRRAGAGVPRGVQVDETVTIDGRELEEALDNLPLLLTQARAVPFFQDGQPVGLRLFAIRDGSLYQKAGLRNGDILKSVNGNSLADISKAAKLFEMLRDERSIVLEMERSRQARTVQYSIR